MQKLLFPTLCDDAADVAQYHSQITMGTLLSSSEKLSPLPVVVFDNVGSVDVLDGPGGWGSDERRAPKREHEPHHLPNPMFLTASMTVVSPCP